MLPVPKVGSVISYAYLWRHEIRKGLSEGLKDRPCVVILAHVVAPSGKTRLVVAPITHRPPGDGLAVELPAETKRRLRLDGERSWIILSETNSFSWPGYDIRRVPHDPKTCVYGLLPGDLVRKIRDVLAEHWPSIAKSNRDT